MDHLFGTPSPDFSAPLDVDMGCRPAAASDSVDVTLRTRDLVLTTSDGWRHAVGTLVLTTTLQAFSRAPARLLLDAVSPVTPRNPVTLTQSDAWSLWFVRDRPGGSTSAQTLAGFARLSTEAWVLAPGGSAPGGVVKAEGLVPVELDQARQLITVVPTPGGTRDVTEKLVVTETDGRVGPVRVGDPIRVHGTFLIESDDPALPYALRDL